MLLNHLLSTFHAVECLLNKLAPVITCASYNSYKTVARSSASLFSPEDKTIVQLVMLPRNQDTQSPRS